MAREGAGILVGHSLFWQLLEELHPQELQEGVSGRLPPEAFPQEFSQTLPEVFPVLFPTEFPPELPQLHP